MSLLSIANEPLDLPEFHSAMFVLDSTGDTKHVWDRRNRNDVATMQALFDEQKAAGMTAYSVSEDGEKDEIITEFDPSAEKIIFSRPLAGG